MLAWVAGLCAGVTLKRSSSLRYCQAIPRARTAATRRFLRGVSSKRSCRALISSHTYAHSNSRAGSAKYSEYEKMGENARAWSFGSSEPGGALLLKPCFASGERLDLSSTWTPRRTTSTHMGGCEARCCLCSTGEATFSTDGCRQCQDQVLKTKALGEACDSSSTSFKGCSELAVHHPVLGWFSGFAEWSGLRSSVRSWCTAAVCCFQTLCMSAVHWTPI